MLNNALAQDRGFKSDYNGWKVITPTPLHMSTPV